MRRHKPNAGRYKVAFKTNLRRGNSNFNRIKKGEQKTAGRQGRREEKKCARKALLLYFTACGKSPPPSTLDQSKQIAPEKEEKKEFQGGWRERERERELS